MPPLAVTARAKTALSLLEKLRRKRYTDPEGQIADLVGVRVITRFRKDVDQCVDVLKGRLNVDAQQSVDKRSQLDLREFGYRSVHLVASLADLGINVPEQTHNSMFEIQVRSILEHAWAENEHALCYKSGITLSKENAREFAAVAGALEILDREFERLRGVLEIEVAQRLRRIQDGSGNAQPLDTAGVIAILAILAPSNPGWLGESASHLPQSSAALIDEAFRSAGLTTPNAVKLAFKSKRFRDAAERFASLGGLTFTDVSHLALGALLAATQDGFPIDEFPDILSDPDLRSALEA